MTTKIVTLVAAMGFISLSCDSGRQPVEPGVSDQKAHNVFVNSTAAQYSIIDLGVGWGTLSGATSINDQQQIVGIVTDGGGYPPVNHAFLWENGKMKDLGTGWGIQSGATCINNRGQVVGAVDDGEHTHAFLWENGVMKDIGAGLDVDTWASSINNSGQVVGDMWVWENDLVTTHAFLWENGVMTDLGRIGVTFSDGVAINDRGELTGNFDLIWEDGYYEHAFLWNRGVITDLGPQGGWSLALSINNRGSVVGPGSGATGGGFVWNNGSMAFLDGFADALCINDRGQIVGTVWDEKTQLNHATLWEMGKTTTLGTLGGSINAGYGINNLGDVVGQASTEGDASEHAVLWSRHVSPTVAAKAKPVSAPVTKATTQITGRGLAPKGPIRGPRGKQSLFSSWPKIGRQWRD